MITANHKFLYVDIQIDGLTLSSGLGLAAAVDLYSDASLCKREGEGAGIMLG